MHTMLFSLLAFRHVRYSASHALDKGLKKICANFVHFYTTWIKCRVRDVHKSMLIVNLLNTKTANAILFLGA
jgi:hypothetical protein